MGKKQDIEDVRELLSNRDQILFHTSSGYSDGKSPMDARRLDQIKDQLAEFGITDENMTLERFDEDVARGLTHIKTEPSILEKAFGGLKNMLKGGAKEDRFQQRLNRIKAENDSYEM